MESQPKRIQRKRTRGWRMPQNTVYVGRPSRWGNPFVVGIDRAATVQLFKDYPATKPALVADVQRELRGKDLACWCALDQPCHADVLLAIANRGQP